FSHNERGLEKTCLATQFRGELEWDDWDFIANIHRSCRILDKSLHEVNRLDEVALSGGVGPENGCALEQLKSPEGDAVVQMLCVRTGDETKGLRLSEGTEVADAKLDQHDGTSKKELVARSRGS